MRTLGTSSYRLWKSKWRTLLWPLFLSSQSLRVLLIKTRLSIFRVLLLTRCLFLVKGIYSGHRLFLVKGIYSGHDCFVVEPFFFLNNLVYAIQKWTFFLAIHLAHSHYFPLTTLYLGILYYQLDLIHLDEVQGTGCRIIDSPVDAYCLHIFLLQHFPYYAYL